MYGPAFKRIDTCAAEFAALTPYMYSTYESPLIPKWAAEKKNACESIRRTPRDHHSGGGPNRIGQASSSTIAAAMRLLAAERGYETIMVTAIPKPSPPITTLGPAYFEPLTLEDVLEIIHKDRKKGTLAGVIDAFGARRP